MERFLTRQYVAVTWSEALRLAQLDGTPLAHIQCMSNVHLIHRTEWWAWWSDERITPALSLPESLCPEKLSPDAVALISEVWESEALRPQCGWKMLANVQRILRRERLHMLRSVSNPLVNELLIKLTVQFTNRDEGILYGYYQFFLDSYCCDISPSLSGLGNWS